jgi:hypothetical protein
MAEEIQYVDRDVSRQAINPSIGKKNFLNRNNQGLPRVALTVNRRWYSAISLFSKKLSATILVNHN